jgi:hypothetical protein
VFYQLMKNIGPGTLRTNSGLPSEPCWNPSAAPVPEACPWPITDDIITGYAKASAATGWGIIPEINLAQNSATWAIEFGVRFAEAVRSTPGSRLTGFELGNEPDLYPTEILFGRSHIRAPSYSWRDLVKDWQPYISAFHGNPITRNLPLIGPAFDSAGWTTLSLGSFIDQIGPKNFGFVTVHYYPTNDCGGRSPTIGDLLSRANEEAYLSDARSWVLDAKNRGLPLVLGETNSTACEGQKGVSDVFASTVWGLDWLFANFGVGMRSVYFHLNNSYYSPVFVTTYQNPDDGDVQYVNFVSPLYYAMYAFSQFAEGKHALRVQIQTSANIVAYAVREESNGPVTVFVINKDLDASGRVTISSSTTLRDGHLLVISSPSLASRSVSYGGVEFSNDTGLLTAKPRIVSVPRDGAGKYVIQLPTSSIAVLKIDP